MQSLKSRTAMALAMSVIAIASALAANPAKKVTVPAVDTTAAAEVVSAFRRMESKVSVGISFSRYKEELPDLNYAVKEFVDSEFARQVPLAVIAYQEAEKRYRNAAIVWHTHIELRPKMQYLPEGGLKHLAKYCPLRELVLEKVPEDALDLCLSDIWERASELSEEGRKIINEAKNAKPAKH